MSDDVTFDEFADAPELRYARDALAAGDLAAFHARWEPQDWRGRSVLTGVAVTADEALGPVLAAAYARRPGDPMAGILLAWHLVLRGWAIRTGRWARDVTAEQAAGFLDHLHRAERLLIELTARHPGHVSAWECRIVTAKGLGLGVPEARRRYEHAMRAGTLSYAAQSQLLANLAPKWGGSWEALHAHAWECLTTAPAGAPNAAVVAAGHLAHWGDLDAAGSAGYFDHPQVRAEIHEAANRSVRHPEFRDLPWTGLEVRNMFAFLFHLLDDRPAAAAQFAAMGRFGRTDWWDDLDRRGRTGAESFRRARAWALSGGPR